MEQTYEQFEKERQKESMKLDFYLAIDILRDNVIKITKLLSEVSLAIDQLYKMKNDIEAL